uniref:Cellulase n=1 Tax=Alexandrium monilatum TaxID=311494 RepID=A0A7S4PS11_9DINO
MASCAWHAAGLLLASLFATSAGDAPPAQIIGRCTATCVGSAKWPCHYTPTYPVWFRPNGTFNWRAPILNSSAVEVGQGYILSEVAEQQWENGTWAAHYYGGNRYEPDPRHVTHCACYYLEGTGYGGPWRLYNYGVADPADTAGEPVSAVCARSRVHCPATQAEAAERWGSPFVESYLGCVPDPGAPEILVQ